MDNYLKVLSGMFLFYYRMGLMKGSPAYEYPYFLKKLVRPGDTVLDIGANLGYYSYILAGLVGPDGKVYAVEPVKPILNVLKYNLRKFSNVEICNYALGAEEKLVRMGNDSVHVGGYLGTGQNFVMDRDTETGADVTFEAEMKRGSRLFGTLPQIDFIKCDIEGYEKVVLTEMESVIRKHMPIVLLETGGDNRCYMIDFFISKGYGAFVLSGGKLRRLAVGDGKDIIFIPPARIAAYQNEILP